MNFHINLRWRCLLVLATFILGGCGTNILQVKKIPDAGIGARMDELRKQLASQGVPPEWFNNQVDSFSFRLHSNIGEYFQKSPEKQTDRDHKHNLAWYFTKVDVNAKIKNGKVFIKDYEDVLSRSEAKHGIHKELITAIIGLESNYADRRYRGKFYVFNALVSQYLFTNRKNFAVREITSLYRFSKKTNQSPWLKGSYAGAIGWGQFIPSALLSFFVDENGIPTDTDPFSIEDTIFSIENYLYRHGLSQNNIHNPGSRYKAVYAYNPSDAYVKAVLHIYQELRR